MAPSGPLKEGGKRPTKPSVTKNGTDLCHHYGRQVEESTSIHSLLYFRWLLGNSILRKLETFEHIFLFCMNTLDLTIYNEPGQSET